MSMKKKTKSQMTVEQNITGFHIVGKVFTSEEGKMKNMEAFRPFLSKLIKHKGLNELGSSYHQFSEGGFTGVVILAESHVSIHTWPELQCLMLDVYLCNYSRDNTLICRELFAEICEFFSPTKINQQELAR